MTVFEVGGAQDLVGTGSGGRRRPVAVLAGDAAVTVVGGIEEVAGAGRLPCSTAGAAGSGTVRVVGAVRSVPAVAVPGQLGRRVGDLLSSLGVS